MGTQGGAKNLGRDDVGRIAPGMAADFVGWRTDGISFAGAQHDLVAALLFCTPGLGPVDLSVINGEVIVKAGQLNTCDLKVGSRVKSESPQHMTAFLFIMCYHLSEASRVFSPCLEQACCYICMTVPDSERQGDTMQNMKDYMHKGTTAVAVRTGCMYDAPVATHLHMSTCELATSCLFAVTSLLFVTPAAESATAAVTSVTPCLMCRSWFRSTIRGRLHYAAIR